MSDPVNAYPAAGQEQQAYGQPQQAYGQPTYALNPEIEKIRSNASTARMLSFLSFLFGHLLLAGGMWIWTNKLLEEAKILGAPMDVVADVESARSAAKICSIIQIAFVVLHHLDGDHRRDCSRQQLTYRHVWGPRKR